MAVTDTDARDNRLTFVICQTFVMGLLINMQFCMYASLLVHVGAVRGSAVRDDLDEHSEVRALLELVPDFSTFKLDETSKSVKLDGDKWSIVTVNGTEASVLEEAEDNDPQ